MVQLGQHPVQLLLCLQHDQEQLHSATLACVVLLRGRALLDLLSGLGQQGDGHMYELLPRAREARATALPL